VPRQRTPVENPQQRLKQCLTKHLRHSIISPRAKHQSCKKDEEDEGQDGSWKKDKEAQAVAATEGGVELERSRQWSRNGAGVTTGDKESALCWLTELSTNCASKWRKFKKYIYI